MKSSVPLLEKITSYIVKRKGKQIRPLFVFLSAKLCGQMNDSTYRAASLIELLHTATLVHDDVLDCAANILGGVQQSPVNIEQVDRKLGDSIRQETDSPLRKDPECGARHRAVVPAADVLPNPLACAWR